MVCRANRLRIHFEEVSESFPPNVKDESIRRPGAIDSTTEGGSTAVASHAQGIPTAQSIMGRGAHGAFDWCGDAVGNDQVDYQSTAVVIPDGGTRYVLRLWRHPSGRRPWMQRIRFRVACRADIACYGSRPNRCAQSEATSLCPHEGNRASGDGGHAGASAGVLGVGQHGGWRGDRDA